MNELLLRLVSLDWNGKALLVWVGFFFDLAKSIFALGLVIFALYCFMPSGHRLVTRLTRDDGPTIPKRLVFFVVIFLAALLTVLKTAQYLCLQGTTDAAACLAVIWNALHGGFMPSPVFGLTNALADHFVPILILHMPLARLFGSPLLVIILHSLLVSSSLILLWRLAKAISLPKNLSWLLCLLWACNPYFHNCLFSWLYPETLPLPIFLLALAAWEKKRYDLFCFFAALLLCTKEEAGLALFALGFSCFWIHGRRRPAVVLMAAASAAFFATAHFRSWLMPSLADGKWVAFFGGEMGRGGVVGFVLSHKAALLKLWFWPPERFIPFLTLLLQAGGFVFLFPPALMGLLLLNFPHQAVTSLHLGFHRLDNYYSAYILPLLFWGIAHALIRLWRVESRRPVIVAWLLACSAAGLWKSSDYVGFYQISGKSLRAGWACVFMVHPEEAVWAPQALAPALAFRKRISVIEGGIGDVKLSPSLLVPDVILVLKSHLRQAGKEELLAYLKKHRFALVKEELDLAFFRRLPEPE